MVSDDPATCPLCGDEKASAKSVEQHISGSSDSVHKGEHGPDHREEIEAGTDPDDGPGDDPGGDSGNDSDGVNVESPLNGGPPSQDTDTSQEPESSTIPAPGSSSEEDVDDQDGGGLVGVVVLLVAIGVLAFLAPQDQMNQQSGSVHPFL
jgi:hypothetical protein